MTAGFLILVGLAIGLILGRMSCWQELAMLRERLRMLDALATEESRQRFRDFKAAVESRRLREHKDAVLGERRGPGDVD